MSPVPARHPAPNSLDFFAAAIIVGLLAGVAGVATTVVLRLVQHATYHYQFGAMLAGVAASGLVRRTVGPMIGGALAGAGWWLLRRRVDVPPLAGTIMGRERVPRLPWSLDALLQVLLVGSGASLGREGAPRQLAAALGDAGTGWLRRLSDDDRRTLLACAAGAGLGAVYAVPLAGALFAVRILLQTWQPRAVGAALLSSGLAVAVGSAVTRDEPNLHWPVGESTYLLTAHGLLLAPVTLLVGLAFNRLMAVARPRAAMRGWLLVPALAGAGLVTGLCSYRWPELPGNGRSILTVSLASGMTLVSALAILALKPLLTALFLRAGGAGGLLTPSLATGAAAGAALVLTINWATGTDLHVPAVSLAGAAGVLAVTQGSPIWAAIFVWELARPPLWLFLLFLLTATSAHGMRVLIAGGGRTHAG
ncbi:chloride ion channel protein [Mycobacterium sp. E2462]|uniref:chloride channel protein n=1 Tax=Mycobacterium sp. E2462 TaxID=1834133 RepID=UPI0007FEACD2|nr:chloride channel protein [Mycobacterium sp. E2462]OBI21724.1 chloride ion channel protein [Mycobacterium sp. E2462]